MIDRFFHNIINNDLRLIIIISKIIIITKYLINV